MDELPYWLKRDYLVDCKYRLGIAQEQFEKEKEGLSEAALQATKSALAKERSRIAKLDRRFEDLYPMLEEYYSIVDSE